MLKKKNAVVVVTFEKMRYSPGLGEISCFSYAFYSNALAHAEHHTGVLARSLCHLYTCVGVLVRRDSEFALLAQPLRNMYKVEAFQIFCDAAKSV